MDKYIAEFLGTGFLFCAVVGSGIMAENLSTGDQALILLINTIATFFALYFLITAFNSFSNHFNPIVSFVIYLDQKNLTDDFNKIYFFTNKWCHSWSFSCKLYVWYRKF